MIRLAGEAGTDAGVVKAWMASPDHCRNVLTPTYSLIGTGVSARPLASFGPASAIVELKAETDFVAKSPDFVALATDLAETAAAKGEPAVFERQSEVQDLAMALKENIALGHVVRFEPQPGATIGTYLHIQAGRGVNAVMVEMAGGSDQLGHDVAVHVAFARPRFLSRDQVPAEEVEAERAILLAISRNEGKPEAALPKIVEGRMNGWFKERCLLDQSYVRDEKVTVAQLIGDARIVRFAQVLVGA